MQLQGGAVTGASRQLGPIAPATASYVGNPMFGFCAGK
jgi:hypothetical protein